MERIMSVEEKIKRAEEIYARRKEERGGNTARVGIYQKDNKKDIRLLKKMIIQIIVCLLIYFVIYVIQNGNYIFSQDFLNKVNEIISYDVDFMGLYERAKNSISDLMNKNNQQNNESQQSEESQEGIGGAIEQTENQEQVSGELSQNETDIQTVKNTTSFIKPIEGQISSKYGQREPSTPTVPKQHTGLDIAAPMGTKIKAATAGEVVLNSSEGDYRQPFKNTNRGSEYHICTLQCNVC